MSSLCCVVLEPCVVLELSTCVVLELSVSCVLLELSRVVLLARPSGWCAIHCGGAVERLWASASSIKAASDDLAIGTAISTGGPGWDRPMSCTVQKCEKASSCVSQPRYYSVNLLNVVRPKMA